MDQGSGGVVPCICQLLNTLIPLRNNPSTAVSCNASALNCPTVYLCCPFVKVGEALNMLIKFINRAIVALWQPWDPLPEFFINFIFCDEQAGSITCGETANACAFTGLLPVQPKCGCGTFTCGKLIPIINLLVDPLTGLISQCVCAYVTMLDQLLALVFSLIGDTWQNCFCGPTNGTLRTGPYVLQQVLIQLIQFLRLFPLPCYWNPAGITFTTKDNITHTVCTPVLPNGTGTPGCFCKFEPAPVNTIEQSWIYSFLGPIANALCISVGNLMCFVNTLFFIPGGCLPIGERFLGSTVRWGVELVFRVVTFIEGFIRQFTDPQQTCVGENPACSTAGGGSYNGVSASPLGQILTSLLSWPVDTFLGDSIVACSRICPQGISYTQDAQEACNCYRRSPRTECTDVNKNSVWETIVQNITVYTYNYTACPPCSGPFYNTANQGVWVGTSCYAFYYVYQQLGNKEANDAINYMNHVNPGACLNPKLGVDSLFQCQYARQAVNGPVQQLESIVLPNGSYIQVGDVLGACQNFDDFVPGELGLPGTCANFSLCRPDSLPSCGAPENAPPDLVTANYMGSIDGQIMGLFRYIGCAGGPTAQKVMQIPIDFFSFVWQIYGAVMNFISAIVIFCLSFFSLTGGCGCWDTADPKQNYSIVHYLQGRGFDGGFCYACPDAHGQCGSQYQTGAPLTCEPHCPNNQITAGNEAAAISQCIVMLTAYSNQALWPSSATAQTLCDGTFLQNNAIVPACGAQPAQDNPSWDCCKLQVIQTWAFRPYKQMACSLDYCQYGGSGTPPWSIPGCNNPSGLQNDYGRGSEENANPVVLCSFLTTIQDFLNILNAAAAIFETPLMIPNQRRRIAEFVSWLHLGVTYDEDGQRADSEPPPEVVDAAEHQRAMRELDAFMRDNPRLRAEADAVRAARAAPKSQRQQYAALGRLENRSDFYDWLRGRGRGQRPWDDSLRYETYTERTANGTVLLFASRAERLAYRGVRQQRQWTDPHDGSTGPPLAAGDTLTTGGYDQNIPSGPEMVLRAMYGYSTEDCFDDTPSCVCRNFYIPQYCSWTATSGVVPNPARDRRHMPAHLRGRQDAVANMTQSEVLSILTETFTNATSCDHVVGTRARMDGEAMPSHLLESWVDCVDQRIQGERLAAATSGVVPPEALYHSQSPLTIFGNVVNMYGGAADRAQRNANRIRAQRRDEARAYFAGRGTTFQSRTTYDRRGRPVTPPPPDAQQQQQQRFTSGVAPHHDIDRELRERADAGRRFLRDKMRIQPDSPMFEAIVQVREARVRTPTR